ncbi:RIO-type serine-threonine-protein kinase Rio1 [Marine Group I thaumarchaeote SCGC AAA799-O18]|jgi:RIO kinase 1|nr:RIO-type serine-threonine-protein kinase Rio1 [Marine Group I thaumarchaeote SCGC AAA799-O18]
MTSFSENFENEELFLNANDFSKIKKHFLSDGFKKNKTVNEVLDKSTVMILHDMIRTKIISYVNGIVSAGKESVVFWGMSPDKHDIALKVYLTSTSSFKKRSIYIEGDPRFSRIKKNTRSLVYLWAKKEYKNLIHSIENGISVVKPITVKKNVLAMEFIGKKGVPTKTLVQSQINEKDYKSAMSLIKQLYKQANLVHCDFSEYNIFKTNKGLILFDMGSAIDLEHPNAKELLKRDINNISKFFVKRGLTVENPIDVFNRITNEL